MARGRRGMRGLAGNQFQLNKGSGRVRFKNKMRGNLRTSDYRRGEVITEDPGNTLAWTRSTGSVADGAEGSVNFDDLVVEGIAGQLIITTSTGAAASTSTLSQVKVGATQLIHSDGTAGVSCLAFAPDPQNDYPLAVALTNDEKTTVTVKNNSGGALTYFVTWVPLDD